MHHLCLLMCAHAWLIGGGKSPSPNQLFRLLLLTHHDVVYWVATSSLTQANQLRRRERTVGKDTHLPTTIVDLNVCVCVCVHIFFHFIWLMIAFATDNGAVRSSHWAASNVCVHPGERSSFCEHPGQLETIVAPVATQLPQANILLAIVHTRFGSLLRTYS